jgi:hypothetical protein
MIAQSLSAYAPVGLEALNAKAAMLERLDHKYIIPAARLAPAFDTFRDLFDVLEIDGKRAFTYATRYFDDPDQRGYYDHHQGRRKRCKVRVRSYLDAGFSYLEVKLKDLRDVTIKKRLKVPEGLESLDEACLAFIDSCYRKQYGEEFARPLQIQLGMQYQRITLVAKEGGERMTVDTGLRFWSPRGLCDVPPDLFIIETKSARGNGIADRILRTHHLHPTKRCSKYCVAMAALGEVAKANQFLPALRKLGLGVGSAVSGLGFPVQGPGWAMGGVQPQA